MDAPDRAVGSPTHLVIARIVAPWGLKGEVRVRIVTDFPDRFHNGLNVFLGPASIPSRIQRSRKFKDGELLKLAGYDTPEQAERLRGMDVSIALEEAVGLPEGDYFYHQIIGLRVETEQGDQLGHIDDIIATGSNDVYLVKSSQGEVCIPAIETVVLQVDLEAKLMVVRLPEGLI
jgi:16S rRNA processing protein RimM